MEQKLAARIRERVDAEAREKLSGVVERLNQRVFDPLNTLLLDPQLISAQTTATRFWMRLRLAGDNHLGSHTPRPKRRPTAWRACSSTSRCSPTASSGCSWQAAPSPCPHCRQHVAQCLNCPSPWAVDPDNADVKITFAKQDPIVVHCRDGQVVVTVSFARLSKASASRKWTNFQVRAFYRPRANGRSVELVRDGVIHFPSGGDQLALRGVFSRVFSKDAAWQLVPRQIIDDPRLGDTAITQLVVDDGWIGISLGPKPPRYRLAPPTGGPAVERTVAFRFVKVALTAKHGTLARSASEGGKPADPRLRFRASVGTSRRAPARGGRLSRVSRARA